MNLSRSQIHILHHLLRGNSLTRDNRKGTWFDSAACQWFNQASCQWLLDHGFIELAGSSPNFEAFKLADLGFGAIADHIPGIERMAA